MPKVTIAGIIFVHIALILYTLFIIFENRKQKTTKSVLVFITLAVIFDIAATTCMMIGTTRTYFTFHGIVGYIGLLLMVVDAFLLWKYKFTFLKLPTFGGSLLLSPVSWLQFIGNNFTAFNLLYVKCKNYYFIIFNN
jgi:EamA domain-containing membrane protein RarD